MLELLVGKRGITASRFHSRGGSVRQNTIFQLAAYLLFILSPCIYAQTGDVITLKINAMTNAAEKSEQAKADKYASDAENIDNVFTEELSHYTEPTASIMSAMRRRVNGENEFERRRDAKNVEKRYQATLKMKFMYRFDAALPEYNFKSKAFILPEKWGVDLFPVCGIWPSPRFKFPAIKIAEESAESLRSANASVNVEIIFKVTGPYTQHNPGFGTFEGNRCRFINAKATLGDVTIYAVKQKP